MEIITSKNEPSSMKGNISADGSVIIPGLKDSIKKLQQNFARQKGGIGSNILMKTQNKKVVLTAAHDGTEIYSYQSNDSVTIQVFDGILKFESGGKIEVLTRCQSLILYENVEFRLTAIGETMFLITILKDQGIPEADEPDN